MGLESEWIDTKNLKGVGFAKYIQFCSASSVRFYGDSDEFDSTVNL